MLRRALLLLFLPLMAWGQRRAPVVLTQAVAQDEALHSDLHAVPDGQGGQYVVWRRLPGGSTQAGLVAQHVSGDGQLLWPAGVVVCPEAGPVDRLALIDDGQGGCIVGWEDARGGRSRVYLQRLNARGDRLWPERGLPASVGTSRQFKPALATDYQGGAYVCWEEEVSRPGAPLDRDIVGQRITAGGSYVFKPLGLVVSGGAGQQQNVQLAATPAQGVLALWEDFRSGAQWQLYAQQLTPDGRAVWPTGGVSLAPPRAITQRYPTVFADGFGGLVCVYEALGGLNLDRDLYAMRVNRSGVAVYHRPIAVRPADQTRPIVLKRAEEAYVVWEDHRAGNADLYLQRFDLATGEVRLALDGVALVATAADETDVALSFTGLLGEPVVAWAVQDSAGQRVRTQKFDAQGRALWPPRELSWPLPRPARVAVVGTDRGGAWLNALRLGEGPEVPPSPHTLGLDAEARAIGPREGQRLLELGAARHIRLDHLAGAEGLHGDAYVAWEDYRAGAKNSDLYLQRLDGQGRPRWRSGGIALCQAEGLQSVPVLCAVPGGVVVGWIDRRVNDDNLYVQFIDSTGRPRWRLDGLPLCLAPRSQSNLVIARTSASELVALWTDARAFETQGFDVFYQRFDLEGRMLLGQDGVALATGRAYQNSVAAAGDGLGRVIVAWAEEQGGTYSIQTQLLLYGKPLWTGDRTLAPSAGQQRTPQVGLTPSGAAWVAWSEERTPGLGQVYVALLQANGSPRWGARRPSPSASPQTEPRLQVIGSEVLVSWTDARAGLRRMALRVGLDGTSLWSGPLDLGGPVPELGVGALRAFGEAQAVALVEEARLSPAQLTLTRLEGLTGRTRERTGLRPSAADQAQPVLLSLPGGRMLAAWLERRANPLEARVVALLLD